MSELVGQDRLTGVIWDYAPWRCLQYNEEFDAFFSAAFIGPLPFMPHEEVYRQ